MDEKIGYKPLSLEKLSANIIVKNLWNRNKYIFKNNLYKLKLPSLFKNIIYERYLLIKYIIEIKK